MFCIRTIVNYVSMIDSVFYISYFKEKGSYKSHKNSSTPINIVEPIIAPTGIEPIIRYTIVGCKHNCTAKA